MKSLMLKSILLAAVTATLALVGGYGIGYDAAAQAATRPHGLQFSSLRFSSVPAMPRVRAGRPGARWASLRSGGVRPKGLQFSGRRPTTTHHRGEALRAS